MVETQKQPVTRRDPSLLGKLFSRFVGLIFWVIVSLMMSIIIEWIGIAWVWPEQGYKHSRAMLKTEYSYLNARLVEDSSKITQYIYSMVVKMNKWIMNGSGVMGFIAALATPRSDNNQYMVWIREQYKHYHDYILAVPYMVQLFFIRIAVILFSLPAFILFGLIGVVDGLVERDLRRWGAGRESSNVYNIARKSGFPIFISACVFYISLPVSLHPAWIIMPFAIFFGLTIRVTFERLKKYF